MSRLLLTRDTFRQAVFQRDRHRCVNCGASEKLDAHHIMERRLFSDGGYYLDNGATLCDKGENGCHMLAETTVLTCEQIRERAGIACVVLPEHLYDDERYDKWGNVYLTNGLRVRGELFEDPSVKRVLQPVLGEFTKYVKYPRTPHFPFSPGIGKDDRVADPWLSYVGEDRDIVVTEKMDGEQTTMYNDYIHARSIDGRNHSSRSWVKQLHAQVGYNIPEGWRVCGENLFAKHSIAYDELPSYFLMFSIWNERGHCLGWAETVEWAELLGLRLVPVLYNGKHQGAYHLRHLAEAIVNRGGEGIVVRTAHSFPLREFRNAVAKYVRASHVHTHGHWMREQVVQNGLAQGR